MGVKLRRKEKWGRTMRRKARNTSRKLNNILRGEE